MGIYLLGITQALTTQTSHEQAWKQPEVFTLQETFSEK